MRPESTHQHVEGYRLDSERLGPLHFDSVQELSAG